MLDRIKVNITVVSSVGLENIHFRIQSNITTCVDWSQPRTATTSHC